MPSTQKRVRDLQRLLNRQKAAAAKVAERYEANRSGADSDLGAAREQHRADEIVKSVEEQLSAALQQRQQIAQREKERKHAKKYHMVRFLERKKLTKLIHRLERENQDGSNDAQIEQLREDLAYVL